MTNSDINQQVPVQMSIALTLTETNLIIRDCVATEIGTRCYDSKYDIENFYDVYEKGKKIGTAYSGGVNIFIGNSQVSEQMNFQINEKNELRYRYTYSNMGGEMETRFGIFPSPSAAIRSSVISAR